MFNNNKNNFFTVLIDDEQTGMLFEEFDQAVGYINDNSSWDCRPSGGQMDCWYDAGSGAIYKIVPCDDAGVQSNHGKQEEQGSPIPKAY